MSPAFHGFLLFALLRVQVGLSQRAYLCDRIDLIKNGSMRQDQALQGVHLHVGTGLYDEQFLRWDLETEQWAGLEVELLDQLSVRAGFTYTLVMRDWENITGFTAALQEAMHEQDIVSNAYFFITPRRMGLGAVSPYGFLDAMLYLVSAPEQKAQFTIREVFSFLTPFSPAVWGWFIVLMAGTGIIFRFLENGSNEEDYPEGERCLTSNLDSIFKSSGHVTGASAFTPKTTEGKILLTSWTWCIVLTLSAYTANLASFLVVRAESRTAFGSLREAVAQQRSIVLEQGTASTTWFDAIHPGYSHAVRVQAGSKEHGRLITSRTYEAGLFAKFEVDKIKQDPDTNPECDLQLVGEPLINMQAGWMVLNDVSDHCTALVRDALAIWFLRMDLDGTLTEMVRRNLYPTENCPDSLSAEAEEDTQSLDIESMLGILCLHAAGVSVSVFLRCTRHSAKVVVTRSGTRRFSLSEGKEAKEGKEDKRFSFSETELQSADASVPDEEATLKAGLNVVPAGPHSLGKQGLGKAEDLEAPTDKLDDDCVSFASMPYKVSSFSSRDGLRDVLARVLPKAKALPEALPDPPKEPSAGTLGI